ncbi:potassium channel protein [Synechococcales cyanobacterium C]|uniref:BK channel n=2 Tax=Petrachloros TaxID=2918834 RepID=A0A8K2A6H0_9CYAN|nr:potassium channel protein [Petrachloros mirabilis ULC683]
MQSQVDRFIHAPATEATLMVLILASVGLVTTEVVLDAHSVPYPQLVRLDVLLTSIFAVELSLRYWVARSKDRFFRQYWIDILAIMPLLPIFGIFRLLRLLRLLRVGVLANRNLGRISSPLAVSIGAQLGIFLGVGLIVLVGALGIFLLEGKENPDFASLKDALWWSFFTLISVEPISGEAQTDGGRFLTLLILVGGLTLFAVFTGVVSAVMVQRLKTVMDIRPFELDELRDHIAICGWNRSGHLIIQELQADPDLRHCSIVVVAEFTEAPERDLRNVDHSRLYFYDGDYTTIDVLESIGIHYASRAILLADATRPRSDQDRDARTVLAALTIEKLKPGIYTCAQLLDRKNNVQLNSAGVEDIIVADEVASHLIATSTRNLGASDVLAELLTVQIGNQIYKISLPENWGNLTFWQAAERLKQCCDAMPLAIERKTNGKYKTLVNPAQDESLLEMDRLIVMAPKAPRLNDSVKFRG